MKFIINTFLNYIFIWHLKLFIFPLYESKKLKKFI